jgi:hypothetical protein
VSTVWSLALPSPTKSCWEVAQPPVFLGPQNTRLLWRSASCKAQRVFLLFCRSSPQVVPFPELEGKLLSGIMSSGPLQTSGQKAQIWGRRDLNSTISQTPGHPPEWCSRCGMGGGHGTMPGGGQHPGWGLL